MSSPQTIKVLQIGCGNFGQAHISAWHSLGFEGRLFVADPDDAARARARQAGVPPANISDDFNDFLGNVDVVDIVVPLPAHLTIAQAALAAGKHLMLEKPATRDVGDAQQLAASVGRAGTLVQIGFHMRFHPLALALKQLVEQGAIGQPAYLAAQTCGYKRLRADTGVLRNDAVHFLDLARWLLGAPPKYVFAVLRDDLDCGAPSAALIVLEYGSGAVARIEAGRTGAGHLPDPIVAGGLTTQIFSVVGSRGAAEIDFHAGTLARRRARYHEQHGCWTPELEDVSITQGKPCAWEKVMTASFSALLGAIEHNSASPVPVDEAALEMAVLCDAIERSAHTGTRICLENVR